MNLSTMPNDKKKINFNQL